MHCLSESNVQRAWMVDNMYEFQHKDHNQRKTTKFPFCVTLKLKHCLSYWCPHQLDSCLATDITSTNCHHTNVQNVVLGTGSGCPVGQDIQVLLVSKVKNSVVVCRQVDSTSVLSGPKLQEGAKHVWHTRTAAPHQHLQISTRRSAFRGTQRCGKKDVFSPVVAPRSPPPAFFPFPRARPRPLSALPRPAPSATRALTLFPVAAPSPPEPPEVRHARPWKRRRGSSVSLNFLTSPTDMPPQRWIQSDSSPPRTSVKNVKVDQLRCLGHYEHPHSSVSVSPAPP